MAYPTAIIKGRQTAQLEQPVVLFLIGARFNKLRTFPKWLWFARTMPAMLGELEKNPEAGLLWHRVYLSGRTTLVQQYWKSFDHLLAYSSDKNAEHQPAWARYMRELANDGSIRHLARDLSDRTRQVRMRLRQHAAVRTRRRDAAGACDRAADAGQATVLNGGLDAVRCGLTGYFDSHAPDRAMTRTRM